MGVLREIGRFVGNLIELIAVSIGALIAVAIWAVGFVIDMITDIISWINGKLESLLDSGADEVNVVRGDALADFVQREKERGGYTEITWSQLNAMKNSVINVAMDGNSIIDDQMIRSAGGLSDETKAHFDGRSMLSIKLRA